MDNFFQILIFIIIIISFLNSMFKKKDNDKTPQRPSNSPGPRQIDNYSSEESQKRKEVQYDIVKEIEGLFKDGKTIPTPGRKMESEIEKAKMRTVPVEEHTEDKEWHTENKEWHSENKEWHTEDEEWHEQSVTDHELEKSWHQITSYKRPPKVDATIEKEAEKFERMLAERYEEEYYTFRGLRKNLYSTQTLQEYILITEILGKPVYLKERARYPHR